MVFQGKYPVLPRLAKYIAKFLALPPATCANCRGIHPTNYRGCITLKKALVKQRNNDHPGLSSSTETK